MYIMSIGGPEIEVVSIFVCVGSILFFVYFFDMYWERKLFGIYVSPGFDLAGRSYYFLLFVAYRRK